MPSLTEVRDAAIAALKSAVPEVRVDSVSGGAEAAAVLKKTLGTTTILVTALGAQNAADPRSLDFDVYGQFAALVVIYGRRDQAAREKGGLAAVEPAAQALHGHTFGLVDLGPARVLSLGPLEDAELENNGAWVWAVTWGQPLTLTPPMEKPDESL